MPTPAEQAAAQFAGAGGGDSADEVGVGRDLRCGDQCAALVLNVNLKGEGTAGGGVGNAGGLMNQLPAAELELTAVDPAVAAGAVGEDLQRVRPSAIAGAELPCQSICRIQVPRWLRCRPVCSAPRMER